jgi:hypothetical protein
MLRWVVLSVVVVALASVATVTVQYLPVTPSTSLDPKFPVVPAAARPEGPQPKAVLVGEPTYEFGTLPQRHTGKHAWVVKNEGKGDLKLTMLRSTCSCTLAKFKDGKEAVVKPGESTEIVLEFETRDNNGNYSKGADIGTSDPDLPSFSLYVHGNVFPALSFTPGRVVNMLSISTDKEDHISPVALYSKDRPGVKVLKATSSRPESVLATFEPLSAAECKALKIGQGVKINVNVKGNLPLGEFREEVVLTTDHPSEPETRLTVTGRMAGPVDVRPSRLEMRNVYSKAGGQRDLVVSVRGGRETTITPEKVPPGLKVEIGPETPPRKGQYKMSVIVPPGTHADRIEGEIVLKTDHPRAGSVIVPVSVFIQDAP